MARLPTPGQDDGAWGNILNEYLGVEHNSDGTLKDTGTLSSKASDSTVVHNSGDETVAGIKTFSSSPIVPLPTLSGQVASKAYVDSSVSAGAPDATTTNKGIVQLAGDLGGTAASPTVPGLATKQPLDTDLTDIAGLTPANDDVLQRKAGVWTNRTPAQIKTDLILTKSDVGLANVDNTSDANKPISSATQTALDLKAPLASPTFTGTVTVPAPSSGTDATTKTYVDTQVAGSATPDATSLVKGKVQLAGDLGGTAASPTVPGLADKQPLDSDLTTIAGLTAATDSFMQAKAGAWAARTIAQVKTDLAITNVDNTSDANKPVSSAQQTAIDGRARIIARGSRATASSLTTTIVGVLRIDNVSVLSGHSYRFVCTGIGLKSTVALDSILAELRFSTSGTATTTSAVMTGGQIYMRPPAADSATTLSMAPTYDPPSNQTLSILLTVARALGTGDVSIYADATHVIQITVDDLGVAVSDTGVSI